MSETELISFPQETPSSEDKFEKNRFNYEKFNAHKFMQKKMAPMHIREEDSGAFQTSEDEPVVGLQDVVDGKGKKPSKNLIKASREIFRRIAKRRAEEEKIGLMLDHLNDLIADEAYGIFANQFNAWNTGTLFNIAIGVRDSQYVPSRPNRLSIRVVYFFNNVKKEDLLELIRRYNNKNIVALISFSGHILESMREKSKSMLEVRLVVEDEQLVSVGSWGYDRNTFKRIFIKHSDVGNMTSEGVDFTEYSSDLVEK